MWAAAACPSPATSKAKALCELCAKAKEKPWCSEEELCAQVCLCLGDKERGWEEEVSQALVVAVPIRCKKNPGMTVGLWACAKKKGAVTVGYS